MVSQINYCLHKSYTPNYYHRQVEHDFPEQENLSSRISQIAFQFLCLYQPVGKTCTTLFGSIRSLHHFSAVTSRVYDKKLDKKLVHEFFQTAISAMALAGGLYNFTLGLYCTTSVDIYTNICELSELIQNGDLEKCLEIFSQMIGSSLYLGILVTGSLEIVLASILVQICTQLIQSRSEFKKGRYLEAFAKVILAGLKINQAKGQYQLIQRRNQIFQMQKYNALRQRLSSIRKIEHLYDHPLIALADKVNSQATTLTDAEGNVYNLGTHFHGYGKQTVKGMNISFKNCEEYTELDFKVNHVFRDKIKAVVEEMDKYSQEDLKDLFKIYNISSQGISIKEEIDQFFPGYISVKNQVIDIKSLGKIIIGNTSDCVTLYDRVKIQMEKGKSIYDFHELLSFLDLGDVLKMSADEDMERMKIGQIFRMCFPKQATLLERNEDFFQLSPSNLVKKIVDLSPEMEANFKKYLPKIKLHELYNGKYRFAIDGLTDELHQLGARWLTSALTGCWDDDECMKRVASMLKMGALSSETRKNAGISKPGMSQAGDFMTGGADSVFTQMITKNNESFHDFWYSGKVRFVYSLKALESISYQYHFDNYGNRNLDEDLWLGSYLNRPDIFNFINDEAQSFKGDNEVMIKDRIPPEYLEGIHVQSEDFKEKLIHYLDSAALIQTDSNGHKTILGKALDQFIHVGSSIPKG